MLHTEDGSAFEVGLASSQQNKHTELAPGDPGLGKSVLINTLSEIQISSAQKNLPFIAYIDKGYSAQGLVQLIRDSLPPERKDEAVGIILSNDPEYTRNLFDVMYGAKKPITPEKNFMSSVLCALCVDTGTGQPCNPGDTDKLSTSLSSWLLKSTVKIIRDFIAPQRKNWWIQHCRTRDCMKNMMQPGGQINLVRSPGYAPQCRVYHGGSAGTLSGNAPASRSVLDAGPCQSQGCFRYCSA